MAICASGSVQSMIDTSPCIKSVDSVAIRVLINIHLVKDRKVLTDLELSGNMEDEFQGNILDYYDDELDTLFGLDESKINSLIIAINKYKEKISVQNIEQATGLNAANGTASQVRGMIANIIHQYRRHRELFEEDLQASQLQKENIPKLKAFLQKINEDALDGLNKRFEISRSLREYNLDSAETEIYLKEIQDENDVSIGYVPVMRVFLTLGDGKNGTTEVKKFDMELDKFTSLIKMFEIIREDFLQSAIRYKNKLGDSLILPEDER